MDSAVFRCCIEFAKEGPSRFLSHLDLQAAFERSLRRARLPLAYSQGFHPRAQLQFEEALPLGWASECEHLWVDLYTVYPMREIQQRLAAVLPAGLSIRRAFASPGKPRPALVREYLIRGSLPADFLSLVRNAFPLPDDKDRGDAPLVVAEQREEGVFVSISIAHLGVPLSLKKILRAAQLEKEGILALEIRRLSPRRLSRSALTHSS